MTRNNIELTIKLSGHTGFNALRLRVGLHLARLSSVVAYGFDPYMSQLRKPNRFRYWLGLQVSRFSAFVAPSPDRAEQAALAASQEPTRAVVDRVWWSSPDGREQYICLRLVPTEEGSLAEPLSFGTPPSGSSYQLRAAALFDLTLSPVPPAKGETLRRDDARVEAKS